MSQQSPYSAPAAHSPDANPLFRPGSMEILVCAVTAMAYMATLAFGFVYDDVPQILSNPAIHDFRYLPQYFTSHVWAAIYPNAPGSYYRPLFLVWLRINYALFGPNPFGWHATSIVCHVAVTYLVFRFVLQLARDRMIAFSAALLFGLHPAHIENVAWISGVADPLMALFVLGSCSLFLDYCDSRKASQYFLSLGLGALALLSKEPAVILPALIFALALIRPNGQTGTNSTVQQPVAALRVTAPFFLLTLIYLGVRYRALNGFAHPVISISWRQVFLTWPSVLMFYAKHLIFPVHLSEFYSLDYVRQYSAKQVAIPFLLLLAGGIALYYWIRALPQKQVALFALVLLAFPLLPVLDLRALTAGDVVHDRYLYLPSAGFVLLVALAIAALGRLQMDRRRMVVVSAVTGGLSLIFAVLTVAQQTQWYDDIRLYTRGLESAPDNLTVRDNLANALLNANQPLRAIPLYLDVLQRNPNFWRSNYNLGFVYYKTGNLAAAEQYLQRAIRIDQADSDQYIYLALVELQLKKFDEARDHALQAIARNPKAPGYEFILGMIYESQGDAKSAVTAFKSELAQHPDNHSAMEELQKIEGSTPTAGR